MKPKSRLFDVFTILSILAVMMAVTFALIKVKPSLASSENLESANVAELATYIIQLADAPLASYRGGINGLAATSPQATGARKLSNTAATAAYLNYLTDTQTSFMAAMEQTLERPVTVKYTYQHAFNGMAVEISAAEAKLVGTMPGVLMVSRETMEHVLTDAGPTWIGAPGIWDGTATGGLPGTKGEDVVVAVLDTGINSMHPSFADVGGDGYDHTNPLGVGNYLGVCDSGNPDYDPEFHCNDKLIGVHDFIDGTGNDPNSPEDGDGHGSHTASTVAGNVVSATLYAPTTALTRTISGVAPHANIIAYDVCRNGPSSEGGGCPGTALLAAANQVVIDTMALPNGIAAINYSISGGNNPYYDAVELAFLAATDAGVFVSASAGNDGPTPSTVAHVSPWVDTVAASTHNRVLLNSLIDMTSDGDSLANITGKSFTSGYGPAPIVYAGDYPNPNDPNGDPGQCMQPYPAGTFTGEIVICDRGTIARVDKGANVLAGGAGGLVLANAEANGNSLNGDGHYLPAVHITYDDGVALKAWVAANTNTVGTIAGTVVDLSPENGDILASFSSRGPAGALDTLKPDISAPGVDIWAAINDDGDAIPDYGFLSGTSMASPHNAGAAVLMTALHPDWSPHEIKSAMMTTSVDNGLLKEDGVTPADAFDVGAGRVNLWLAGAAGLVLDETTANFQAANPVIGGDPNTLNLANFYSVDCLETCSWTRTVSSTVSMPITWTASANGPAGIMITVDPPQFTLGAYGTQMITVTADVTGLTPYEFSFAEVSLSPAVAASYLDEGFEGVYPPAGWSLYTSEGDDPGWITGTTSTTGSHGDAHNGSFYVWHNDDNIATASSSWLVTPSFTPDSTTVLDFWHRNYYVPTYYDYSGVQVSTGSCDPNDAAFVELTEYDTDASAWSQSVISLSAYAGQSICLAFMYTGDYAHEWYIDDVAVYTPSDIPAAHFPLVVYPTLPPPVINVEPASMTSTQDSGVMSTQPLTITNSGDSDLNWTIFENTLPINAPLVDWQENFDSYVAGSQIIGQGGWEGWGGDPNAGAIVTDTVALSTANSVAIAGPSDLVHQYSGYDTGWWIYTANLYIPSSFSGTSYFILLNSYGGTNNWSTEVQFDSSSGLVVNDGNSGGNMPYITDQWVEVRVEIDLVNNVQDFYYNNTLLYSGSWTEENTGGGALNIAAVDLYANGATPVYYDDISLVETAPDYCDVMNDLPWISVSPDAGTTAVASSDVVDVTFDSNGLLAGLYEGTICVESDDPLTPVWAVPVSMTVTSNPPEMVLDASSFESTQIADTTLVQTLTISNTGTGDLTWDIFEDATTLRLPLNAPLLDTAANESVSGKLTFGDGNLGFTTNTANGVSSGTPSAVPNRPDASVTITHSASQSILAANSVHCGNTGQPYHTDNSYLRQFKLSDFGIVNDFSISSIDIGMESAVGASGSQPSVVNLYTWDESTAFQFVNFSLIGTANVTVVDQSLTVLNVPVTGVAPAGSTLVVEFFTPDGTTTLNSIYIGSNDAGQTAYTYLAAVDCGLTNPVTTDSIGFPDMHLVMNVTGEEIVSTTCDAVTDIPWASVSPISGTVTSGEADLVDITFDATSLPGGVYTGTLCLNSNDPIMPLVTLPLTMTVLDKTYDVVLSGNAALSDAPGTTVTYTVQITNTGNVAEIFDLSASGTWTTTVPATIALDPGEMGTFDVTVVIPMNAANGTMDTAVITATSQTDDTATASVSLTTTAVVDGYYVYLPVISNP